MKAFICALEVWSIGVAMSLALGSENTRTLSSTLTVVNSSSVCSNSREGWTIQSNVDRERRYVRDVPLPDWPQSSSSPDWSPNSKVFMPNHSSSDEGSSTFRFFSGLVDLPDVLFLFFSSWSTEEKESKNDWPWPSRILSRRVVSSCADI